VRNRRTAPSTVGAYEVVSQLGQGGKGEVVDASRVARFEREAQLLASLNHPVRMAVRLTLAA
jgi:serine/threonine protein kinase